MTRAFPVLFRTFFAQFFASESATSDHQVRVAVIGVLAFLITPGFLIPIQMSGVFEFAAVRVPELLQPLIRLMATLFLTYAIVTIGVVAAFEWDALGFDRRDAMVLGPLPVNGATVIGAKLAALAVLVLGAAAAVNGITAALFSMMAGNHSGAGSVGRHFAGHMVATVAAATFVFCVLVTVRAVLGMSGRGRIAIASLMQFVLIAALLCFVAFAPTTLHVSFPRRGRPDVYMQAIPVWSPTNWFLGLYEAIRGTADAAMVHEAMRALAWTSGAAIAAVVSTIASYRRQLQLALTPASSHGAQPFTRILAAVARTLAGGDSVARGVADYLVTTVARNRTQQAAIAMNVAIAAAVLAAALSRTRGQLSALMRPRTLVLWIPLLVGYWLAIGLRAALFVPAELPAAWVFRANAPATSRAYWSATRAALLAFVLPAALLLVGVVIWPLVGWRIAAWHALFSALVLTAFVDFIALTLAFLPFTRAYQPGHAKLKSRWPLYAVGMFAVAYWPVRAELGAIGGGEPQLAAAAAVCAAVLYLAGRRRASRWSIDSGDGTAIDGSEIAVLDIGGAVLQSGP